MRDRGNSRDVRNRANNLCSRYEIIEERLLKLLNNEDKIFSLCHFKASPKIPLAENPAQTGVGGAPKFFLNWLTFALSPYDADHK